MLGFNNRIFSATLFLTLSNASGRALALITMPILTRLLLPSSYGIASIVATSIGILSVLSLSGIDISYSRQFHKNFSGNKDLETFTWRYAMIFSCILASIAFLIWSLYIYKLLDLPQYLAYFVSLGVFANVICTLSTTRTKLLGNYKRLAIVLFVSAFISAISAILIAKFWRQDEFPLIVASVLVFIIPVLLLGGYKIPFRKYIKKTHYVVKKNYLKIGIAGIITAPAYWIICSLDRWFLLHFLDSSAVGIYSLGYTVGIIGLMFNNAINAVWLPEVSLEYEKKPKNALITLKPIIETSILVFAIIWLAVTAGGGDLIRLLASENFHSASEIIPYISGVIFFHGITHLFNTQLILKHKLNYSIKWWVFGAIICVIFNFKLIPIFGITGAAISQMLAMFFIAFGLFWTAQRFLPLKLNFSKILLVILIIILIGICMYPPWSDNPLYSLLFKFPVGVFFTLIVVFFTMSKAHISSIMSKINIIKK